MCASAAFCCYFILDRDEFLSHMTGTKPNQVQWDWSLIQKVGIFGLLAVIALLSQAFPEMWQWMRTFLEPLSRTVR